ncbi:MAG: ABC transporter permease [Firmicutes bacterium]|nr:ABC transporter permease [Bacillota bacterium]
MKQKSTKKMTPLRETVYRFAKNKISLIGLAIVILIIFVIIFGEQISPYAKGVDQDIMNRLQGASREHLMGTDGYGRDIFTRVIHGTKYTMLIAFPSVFGAQIIGSILGALAAFYSRWLDDVLMRILDIFQAIPGMLLSLAVVAVLGSSLPNLVIAMMISRIPGATRSGRAVMLRLVGQEHIDAARSYGSTDAQLIFRHVIPNAIGPIIVDLSIALSATIRQVSSLSYIGLGVQPPTPEWGVLLSEAREYMRSAPHTIVFPGIAIALAALAFNLVGDGLRDALDPRLRD